MSINSETIYNKHLLELNYEKPLSDKLIARYNARYSAVLPEEKSAYILDFGCTLGDLMEYLEIKGYKNIEGTDKNPIICTNTLKRTGFVAQCLCNSYEFVYSRNSKFDFINMKDVLGYPEPNQVVKTLKELKNTLKLNGVLIISCPQACGLTASFTLYNVYTHLKLFTEHSLKQLLRTVGFENISLIHPKTKFDIKARSLTVRLTQSIWFKILKIIYLIERRGENMPPYIDNRIAMMAINVEGR